MRIAVLSGKGGTGKTTISTSLAASLGECQYIDCDVEEPNGAIFLKPNLKKKLPVKVLVPQVEESKCDGCGLCGEVCQFNAIAVIKDQVLIFPEICHHCGACVLVCPQKAIIETERIIGVVETNEQASFMQGKLNIGEPVGIPIIRELKERIRKGVPVIIDCPPGASCAVVQSIEDCDYCILVTEPTPFGLHDLKIGVQVVSKMRIPFGVVINKAIDEKTSVHEFCWENQIEILMKIPFSQEIAEGYSRGVLPIQESSEWKERFLELYRKVESGVQV